MSHYRFQHSRASKVSEIQWQVGDIAFLKPYDMFTPQDYADLIATGYLHKDATCHPVILLAVCNKRAIITPISAFRTEEQHFLPPWQQKWHHHKKLDHYRAFEGTQRPDNRHATLRLSESGMKMPKPQASWVYTQSFFCVPLSVLGWFNKTPTLLRVHSDSVRQLKLDIRENFPRQHHDTNIRLHGNVTVPGALFTAKGPQASTQSPPLDPRRHVSSNWRVSVQNPPHASAIALNSGKNQTCFGRMHTIVAPSADSSRRFSIPTQVPSLPAPFHLKKSWACVVRSQNSAVPYPSTMTTTTAL